MVGIDEQCHQLSVQHCLTVVIGSGSSGGHPHDGRTIEGDENPMARTRWAHGRVPPLLLNAALVDVLQSPGGEYVVAGQTPGPQLEVGDDGCIIRPGSTHTRIRHR